ncbi:winged helix-turn-helix domain-containing protein [Microbacterium sp. E-13]|uniref:winged helix-turn-helix domain-containing protein n=1 Tax=Microbacterium sp. E-13 TaxID=3404048 RepID=UPI003CFA86C3
MVDALTDHIRAAVIADSYPGHSRLPGERVLARTLGVDRGTLRRALHTLTTEGLLEARRGRYGGTWVRRDASPLPPPTRSDERADGLDSYLRIELLSVSAQSLRGEHMAEVSKTELLSARSPEQVFWADNRGRWRMWKEAGGVDFAMLAAQLRLRVLERISGEGSMAPRARRLRELALALLEETNDAEAVVASYCRCLAGLTEA